MQEELNLTLPERKQKTAQGRGYSSTLLVVVLVLVAIHLTVEILGHGKDSGHSAHASLEPNAMKKLAMKLEKQGIHQAAITAWLEFLATGGLDANEAARIWYRIATIAQEEGNYEAALDALYRSEALAELDDLAGEIGRRTEECLEALGKYTALRYELAQRVGINPSDKTTGDEIVAEIGPQKITRADLDRSIERRIGQQLAQFAAYLPEDQKNKQQEALLKQFSTNDQRHQFLNQLIAEEILHREARERKLAEAPEIRAMLRELERSFLAQRMLETEMKNEIKITDGDLQNYYAAHSAEFLIPARAHVSHILVPDEAEATTILSRLQGGENFDDLAKALLENEDTGVAGEPIDTWIDKGGILPELGSSPRASELIFETDAGQVCSDYVESDKGYHVIMVRERQPTRQKPFDDVRDQVFRTLRSQKEREVQENLLSKLRTQYDVVLHHAAFNKNETEETDTP